MINEMNVLIDKYALWLKDKTVVKKIGEDWIEITTPHIDRHNDCLQIYARKDGNGYMLTDDGYTISDLLGSGCQLDSPKRQDLLKTTLAGFGVHLEKDQLIVHASLDNFSLNQENSLSGLFRLFLTPGKKRQKRWCLNG